jgi:hypothetical protein
MPTGLLVEPATCWSRWATEIVAATDVGDAPMAAASARCRGVVVDQLMVHVRAGRGHTVRAGSRSTPTDYESPSQPSVAPRPVPSSQVRSSVPSG